MNLKGRKYHEIIVKFKSDKILSKKAVKKLLMELQEIVDKKYKTIELKHYFTHFTNIILGENNESIS